jgi:hypothetical protein
VAIPAITDQRVAAGIPGSAIFFNVDQNGVAVDAVGTVTASVARADGSEVVAATTTTKVATGQYALTLTAAQTAALGVLTATWVIAGGGTFTTTIEVVGRQYITLDELFRFQPSLTSTSTAELAVAIDAAEQECEIICDRSFTLRERRVIVDGTGETVLYVPDNDLVSVESILIDTTALTVNELADLWLHDNKAIEWPEQIWQWGRGNITTVYRFGLNSAPVALRQALAVRVRELVNQGTKGIMSRATSYSPESGGTYKLDTADQFSTGNPDVDAVYQRWSLRPDPASSSGGPSTPAPVSRSLTMDPQHFSLFHGGRS